MKILALQILTALMLFQASTTSAAETEHWGRRRAKIYLKDDRDKTWILERIKTGEVFFACLTPRKARPDDRVLAKAGTADRLSPYWFEPVPDGIRIQVDDGRFDEPEYLAADSTKKPQSIFVYKLRAADGIWRFVPTGEKDMYYVAHRSTSDKPAWLALGDEVLVMNETNESLKDHVWEYRRPILSTDKKYTFKIYEPVESK